MKNKIKFFKDLIVRISQQSECLSRHVGCIIVQNDRVIAEGWNSPPRRTNIDECQRCKRTRCPDCDGTGVMHANDDIIEFECNNCKGKKHITTLEKGKDLNLAICTHAEINAISSAAYLGYSIKNSSLYSTTLPCSECMKAIISCGIKKVYYIEDYDSPYTRLFAKNAEIELIKIKE